MRKFKTVARNFINSVNCNDFKVVILVLTLTLILHGTGLP